MTSNPLSPDYSEIGYLTVRVSTAGGAIPLENAAVNIRGGDVDDSSVIFALSTNSDGLTPTVSLPTPPRSASEAPQISTRASHRLYGFSPTGGASRTDARGKRAPLRPSRDRTRRLARLLGRHCSPCSEDISSAWTRVALPRYP